MNELEILRTLEKYHNFVSIDLLISELQMSKRTLQYALKELEAMSDDHGFVILKRRGQGYMLNINDAELYHALFHEYGNQTFDNLEASVSCCLALHMHYITVDQLCEIFLVGRTTILNCTNAIETNLANHKMTLKRKQHYGWKALGDLENRMQLLSAYYASNNVWLRNQVKHHVTHRDMVVFESTLLEALSQFDFEINSAELEEIRVWVYMYALFRRETFCWENQKAKDHTPIEEVCDIVFTTMNWEMESLYYSEFKKMLSKSARTMSTNNVLFEKVTDCTEHFLTKTDIKHQTQFNADEDFKRLLMIHVSLLVERLQENKTYSNYLTNEIAFKYPTMFTIALSYCKELDQCFDVAIPPEEVAFIAAYFAVHMEKESNEKLNQFNRIAVVCGTGGGSAMFIKIKIEAFFPNATVKTFSIVEMLNLKQFHPNLIFTIRELDDALDVPIIKINELVEDVQLLRIQSHLKNIDSNITLSGNDVFDGLMHQKIWKRVVYDSDYVGLITEMADELIALGYADDNYTNYIVERESYMSTVYLNGVAMPHPMQMNVKRNAISIAIVDGECKNENGSDVKIVFMMCLNQKGYEVFKDITKELYDLMHDRMFVMKLAESKTYDEFRSLFRRRKQWNL